MHNELDLEKDLSQDEIDLNLDEHRFVNNNYSMFDSVTQRVREIKNNPKKTAHELIDMEHVAIDMGAEAFTKAVETVKYVWNEPSKAYQDSKDTLSNYAKLGAESLLAGYHAFRKNIQEAEHKASEDNKKSEDNLEELDVEQGSPKLSLR